MSQSLPEKSAIVIKRFQCRHIHTDGRRCASPSLRGEDFCYFHHTTRSRVAHSNSGVAHSSAASSRMSGKHNSFTLPLPEDRSAIQLSIGEVLQRIASNSIDPRRAGLLLYGLQIASLNLGKHVVQDAIPVEEFTQDVDLGPLAPPSEVTENQGRESTTARILREWHEKKEREKHKDQTTPNAEPTTLPSIQAVAAVPDSEIWYNGGMKRYLILAMVLFFSLPLLAQTVLGNLPATQFHDTSALKPPVGAKIAIVEFEDLECPYCAMAAPQVRAAAKQYGIPLVHHDAVISYHHWSRVAAIDARYLEDHVSPKLAEDFRLDVFKHQNQISSREDLQRFSSMWFQAHGHPMPFVLDPAGKCAAEVQADCHLAELMGLGHTPTIVVVTAKKRIEVTSVDKLQEAIQLAELDVQSVLPPRRK